MIRFYYNMLPRSARIAALLAGISTAVAACQVETVEYRGYGGDGGYSGYGGYGGDGGYGGYGGYGRPQRAQICFYEDINYGGQSFCAAPGQSSALLNGFWNDRISSIRVQGRTGVRLCEHKNFGGWCTDYSRDVPFVGNGRNDQISSFQVY
ncbi:peptidase inhibitor family I36 protein [Nitratireductor luteus]|uniref:peptidase inhibitor family I36 protein n=1 Tax=Nitratireductor luteus TaxID=2976980 RepID=UPI00223FA471|nr:peptidase inhibitor family I36 protein [Nitratireductor luteus]